MADLVNSVHPTAIDALRAVLVQLPDTRYLCFHPSEQRAFDYAAELKLIPWPDRACPLNQIHLFVEPPDATEID